MENRRARKGSSTVNSGQVTTETIAEAFELRLVRDTRWALSEGSQFFEGRGAVQSALLKITRRLEELGVPYAVAGGMALFFHGVRRFTEDVDLLVSREGLKRIHEELEGRGYLPPFTASKNLRDTELGVKIEFLVTGGFPGDGKPKPVVFPEPRSVAIEREGIWLLGLPALVELKLASGMTQPDRVKDISDVVELIKALDLKPEFSEGLNPYVRPKYLELVGTVHGVKNRYMKIWRNKFLTLDARSLDEMIETLREAVHTLESMRRDGVTLDTEGGTADDYARLVTEDSEVAKKYDMHEESEFWGEIEEEPSKEED